jgi:hypothetical protein
MDCHRLGGSGSRVVAENFCFLTPTDCGSFHEAPRPGFGPRFEQILAMDRGIAILDAEATLSSVN